MKAGALALALAVCLSSCATGHQDEGRASDDPARLESGAFLVTLLLPGDVDRWYNEHWRDEARPDTAWFLASVHPRPEDDSRRIGALYAVMRWRSHAEAAAPALGAALEYRPVDAPESVAWMDAGDWGYGIHTASRRVSGPWMLLPEAVFGGEAWVRLRSTRDGPGIRGDVRSLDGELIVLDPVVVPDGAGRSSESYFVVDTDGDSITLRPEVPSDMPCEGEISGDPAPAEVSRFHVPVAALFGESGRPRFRVAYPKGC